MQQSEPVFVLNSWVPTALDEQLNDVEHIFLNCSMHWCIETNLLIFLNIWITSELKKRLNHRLALSLNSVVERCLSVNIPCVDIDLVVVKKGDGIMDIMLSNAGEQDVSSYLFDFSNHLNFNLLTLFID